MIRRRSNLVQRLSFGLPISSKTHRDPIFTSPSIGDLDNPIHPVFDPQNFVDHEINYRTIENSLRLSSRYITTTELLPFWYMLLCGPIETTTNSHLVLSESIKSLTEEQTEQVTGSLELLASCVRFTSEHSWARGDAGATERTRLDAPRPFRGVKTNVYISHRVFRRIERTFSNPALGNASRLWRHYLLANILVHELAHAAMYAAHPRPPAYDPIQAYFISGARTTEEGLEWEASVFGGLMYEMPSFLFPDNQGDAIGSKIVMREWPSARLVARYRKSIYPRPFPVKGELPKNDRVGLVPERYFERLFTTAFWENDVPSTGGRALRPRCTECFVDHWVSGRLQKVEQER